MAFTYGFYDSFEGDRKYNAEQMSAIFDGIINDGIFASIGDIFGTVPGDGLQVIVKTGRGWLGKTWFYNDSFYPLTIDQADLTLPRLDAVVVEVDHSVAVRKTSLKILKGTPRSTPLKPELTNDGTIFQMPLAYVRVEGGATSIQASGIDVRVGMTDCPFVTGIIETADISVLFQSWDEDFHAWWDQVSSVLNEDTVGQLQLQIDQLKTGKVNISDKATDADITAGISTTTWVTPAGLKKRTDASEQYIAVGGKKLISENSIKFIGIDKFVSFGYPSNFTPNFKFSVGIQTYSTNSVTVTCYSTATGNAVSSVQLTGITSNHSPASSDLICDNNCVLVFVRQTSNNRYGLTYSIDLNENTGVLSNVKSFSNNISFFNGSKSAIVGGNNPSYLYFPAIFPSDYAICRFNKSTKNFETLDIVSSTQISYVCCNFPNGVALFKKNVGLVIYFDSGTPITITSPISGSTSENAICIGYDSETNRLILSNYNILYEIDLSNGSAISQKSITGKDFDKSASKESGGHPTRIVSGRRMAYGTMGAIDINTGSYINTISGVIGKDILNLFETGIQTGSSSASSSTYMNPTLQIIPNEFKRCLPILMYNGTNYCVPNYGMANANFGINAEVEYIPFFKEA